MHPVLTYFTDNLSDPVLFHVVFSSGGCIVTKCPASWSAGEPRPFSTVAKLNNIPSQTCTSKGRDDVSKFVGENT
jgi:hypothetical protein